MILAILQARYSSSRLPGKVLKPILGKPMLLRQIERLSNSEMIDKLVVATSDDTSDDAIEKMCLNNNVEVFRGSLDNVLDRFYQCTKFYRPDHIVRLTGDCPLADWQIIDDMIQYYLDKKLDYMATSLKFPDGLDAEIMSFQALEEANEKALLPSEREHVTQYINKRTDRFKNGIFKSNQDLSHLRLTVDEPEDFSLVEEVYRSLYNNNPFFLTHDVLELLEKNPDLVKINSSFARNEGLEESLQEDKEFLKDV
jgi:spore coat polysaccharide biosynthesis protein SpsF